MARPGLTMAAAGLVLWLGAPGPQAAWAEPVTVGSVYFEAPASRLAIAVATPAEVRTRQEGRKLYFEIPGATARNRTYAAWPDGARVRELNVVPLAGNPPAVRVELTLAPGFDPVVSIAQTPGRVFVSLVPPPTPSGERDLEHFPGAAPGPAPVVADRAPLPAATPKPPGRVIAPPSPVVTPAPPVHPGGAVAGSRAGQGDPWPNPVMAVATPTPAPAAQAPEERLGSRSSLVLDLGQAEAVEDLPNNRTYGYPWGVTGLHLVQWLGNYLGLEAHARYFSWSAVGTQVTQEQDGLAQLRLALRFPLGPLEPSLAGGYSLRYTQVGSGQTDTGPVVAGGLRLQLGGPLAIRLMAEDWPAGLAASQLYRLGAEVSLEFGPSQAAIGFWHDQYGDARGGPVTFDAVHLGLGLGW